jgi:hypothetical protein
MKQYIPILILLLVLAVSVAFAFQYGLTTHHGFGPAIVEQAVIRNVEFITNNSAIVTVENTGGNSSDYTVVIVSVRINGVNATLIPSGFPAPPLRGGVTANLIVSMQGESLSIHNNTFKLQLTTMKGNVADYSGTYKLYS